MVFPMLGVVGVLNHGYTEFRRVLPKPKMRASFPNYAHVKPWPRDKRTRRQRRRSS